MKGIIVDNHKLEANLHMRFLPLLFNEQSSTINSLYKR